MSGEKKERMLIALDGSVRAFECVSYISRIPCFQRMEVVLLHVYTVIPQTYLDFETQPFYAQEVKDIRGWALQEQGDLRDYMENAKKCLIRGGFRDDSVRIDIREIKSGIARDIIEEAGRGGYAAVVAGRRGVSRLSSILLGSVAFKLLEALSFVPLVLVGTDPQPGKILIGIETSEGSMKAVESISQLFKGTQYQVLLLNGIRSQDTTVINEATEKVEPVLAYAKKCFLEQGVHPDRLTTRILSGIESRAGAIVEEAQDGGYGTIVVGRRGLSAVRDFFMGRVGIKVVQLAVEQAVWVMN